MAKTLKADFNGTIITRKTDRNYTHVVIAKYANGYGCKKIGGEPYEMSWASSLQLAEKARGQFKRAEQTWIIPVIQGA